MAWRGVRRWRELQFAIIFILFILTQRGGDAEGADISEKDIKESPAH